MRDETVHLVYLDPPFNSNASYNVLFKAPDGHESHAQMEAFEDTWHWDAPAEKAFDEVMQSGNADAADCGERWWSTTIGGLSCRHGLLDRTHGRLEQSGESFMIER